MPLYKQMPYAWNSWIIASINKHIVDNSDVYVHVEGATRQTDGKSEWIEVRVYNIKIVENTQGNFRITCNVNLAVCVLQNNQIYRLDILLGKAASLLKSSIDVFRYGPSDDPNNNGSHVVCLRLNSELDIHTFGNVKNSNMRQGAVEADFLGYFRSPTNG